MIWSVLDYLEDIRDKKAETNSEAQRLVDEVHAFTQSYIEQIQRHSETLVQRVHENRAQKLRAIEETIADIEMLENETENALDIRFLFNNEIEVVTFNSHHILSRVASKMEGSFMLSMMDHITTRLTTLDKKNDDLYTDDNLPKLRFDATSRQTKDKIVICGGIFVHSRFD